VRRLAIASTLLATACVAAPAATSAAAATLHWANLRSVTVTVANGSLPPPYGRPQTKRFTTTRAVKRATAALNANGIARRAPVRSNGCAGGVEVTIVISRARGGAVRLSSYDCGSQTFGGVAGNVAGFLSAVGVKAP
jgi:hypothetical protein